MENKRRNLGLGWRALKRYERNLCNRHKINLFCQLLFVVLTAIVLLGISGNAR